jgi:dihydrofolate synthase/folylpolyglutamate synthase
VRTCLSIITNVHLEHREYLGATVEEIAVEKAGIIKSGIDVVTGADKEEARMVIERKAGECGSSVFSLGRDFEVRLRQDAFPRQFVTYRSPWSNLSEVEINLAGAFQADNAALALMGLELLQRKGLVPINEPALRAGMAGARWPGRLEKLCDSPFILVDGAHNPSAMRALTQAARELFAGRRIIIVLGMLSDKDVAECLQILRTISNAIIVTQPVYERALPAEKLFAAARKVFDNPLMEPSLAAAVRRAVLSSTSEDIILVCGSLFNIAEVKEFVRGEITNKTPRVCDAV